MLWAGYRNRQSHDSSPTSGGLAHTSVGGDGAVRQRRHNISRAVVIRLVDRRRGSRVVGQFTRRHVIAKHFDTVEPGDETIVALVIDEQIGNGAAVFDGEIFSQIDGGVVA